MSLAQRITDLGIRIATEFKTVKSKISGNNTGDLSGLTTTAKGSLLAAINEVDADVATINNSKGAANGIATLGADGKVPSGQLPGFVDDIIEVANFAALPGAGAAGLLYVTLDTNLTYRWSGSGYVEVSASLVLGETSGTAYRGDRGAIAYTHSQAAHDYSPSGHNHDERYYTETEIGNPETDFEATFIASL